MNGLLEIDFGSDAAIRNGGSGLVRRIRHRDIAFEMDATDEVGLVLNLSDVQRVSGSVAGTHRSNVPEIGTISVFPPGPHRLTVEGESRILAVKIPLAHLADASMAIDRDPGQLDVRPRFNEDDPVLARALYAATVADTRDEADRLDGVALRLLHDRRSGAAADESPVLQGGIAPMRLRRVLDLVASGLDGPLPTRRLAAEAGLSPYHFARAFARSVGIPPHRFVARQRVARAIRLLARTDLTMAVIARRAGFSHRSHLARSMRQITGQSAATFRDCILP